MLLALGVLGGPLVVHASGVDDAQRSVDQVLDELDNLRDQLGQIDEDYGGALDRQDQLVVEIAASQARVADLTAQLGGIQSAMQQVALARFTSGDSLSLSPIFSDATTYSAAGQRTALGLVAIDTGAGDVDELQSLVDDLADEQASLDRKQQEAASLIATLEQKRKDFEQLEQTYLEKEATARAALGDAKLAAEEERRAAAVAEQAQRVRDQNNSTPVSTVAPPRGGGGNTGGGSTGGGSTGGGSTGGVAPVAVALEAVALEAVATRRPCRARQASPSRPRTASWACPIDSLPSHPVWRSTAVASRNGHGVVLACTCLTRAASSSAALHASRRIRCSPAT